MEFFVYIRKMRVCGCHGYKTRVCVERRADKKILVLKYLILMTWLNLNPTSIDFPSPKGNLSETNFPFGDFRVGRALETVGQLPAHARNFKGHEVGNSWAVLWDMKSEVAVACLLV